MILLGKLRKFNIEAISASKWAILKQKICRLTWSLHGVILEAFTSDFQGAWNALVMSENVLTPLCGRENTWTSTKIGEVSSEIPMKHCETKIFFHFQTKIWRNQNIREQLVDFWAGKCSQEHRISQTSVFHIPRDHQRPICQEQTCTTTVEAFFLCSLQ